MAEGHQKILFLLCLRRIRKQMNVNDY